VPFVVRTATNPLANSEMKSAVFALSFVVGLSAALSIQHPANLNQENVSPPPHEAYARMARYIVHQSDWTTMATFSTRMPGYPTANVFSVSDGTLENSSGIPYFYLTDMELSMKDLAKNNRASITMSLAQGDFCKDNQLDPENPMCAHIILTGKVVKLEENSDEQKFAKEGLFTRHAEMAYWPAGHGWTFRKLEIENIMLLDYYGGVQTVNIDDYLKATPH